MLVCAMTWKPRGKEDLEAVSECKESATSVQRGKTYTVSVAQI